MVLVHRRVFADANHGTNTRDVQSVNVEVARALAKISPMRLTNIELHHVDSSQTSASPSNCSRGSDSE